MIHIKALFHCLCSTNPNMKKGGRSYYDHGKSFIPLWSTLLFASCRGFAQWNLFCITQMPAYLNLYHGQIEMVVDLLQLIPTRKSLHAGIMSSRVRTAVLELLKKRLSSRLVDQVREYHIHACITYLVWMLLIAHAAHAAHANFSLRYCLEH